MSNVEMGVKQHISCAVFPNWGTTFQCKQCHSRFCKECYDSKADLCIYCAEENSWGRDAMVRAAVKPETKFAVELALLRRAIPSATVQTIINTDKLLKKAVQNMGPGTLIHSFKESETLMTIVYAYASWAHRVPRVWTGGLLTAMTLTGIKDNKENGLNYLQWAFNKLELTGKPSLLVEIQILYDTEQKFPYMQLQWLEMGLNHKLQPRDLQEQIKKVLTVVAGENRSIDEGESTDIEEVIECVYRRFGDHQLSAE